MSETKRRLMEWNRDAQIDQQIQWTRCYEQAHGSSPANYESRGGNKRSRYGNQDGQGGGKTTWASSTMIKQEGGTPRTASATTKSSTMDINFNRIDKQKWTHTYGETRVNGKVVILCWYHCNRPGGCVRKDECAHDHKLFPSEYKGRHLEKCPSAFQKEVLKKCSGA